MVRKRGFVHRHFFVTEESTLLFRIAKSFYATNSYTTSFLQMTKSLGKSKRWIDFPDVISLKCEASESVQFSTCYDPIHRFWRVKAKSSFFSKIKHVWGKKMHKLSCLTKVYLCAKIETIWIFDPCHKNFIFVWFLHGYVFLNVTV